MVMLQSWEGNSNSGLAVSVCYKVSNVTTGELNPFTAYPIKALPFVILV